MIMTQTIYHKKVAKLLTNNIGPTVKMILVIPGYLGSLYFRNIQDTLGDLLLAEGESTPYDARIVSPGTVKILFKNIRNAVAVLPNSKKAKGFELCRELCDTYVKTRTNIIESALHNPNLIVHTVGAVMSAARIEYSHGDFWMYREGFTPSIWRIIEALDNEKNAVIAYYKGIPSPYLEECKFRNEVDFSKDSMAVFNSYAKHGGPKGPDQVDCRFIYEDVSMGLVLLESLGHAAGIDTTITSSLINIASALTAKDYRTIGRNLSDLSLDLKDKSLLDDIFNGD